MSTGDTTETEVLFQANPAEPMPASDAELDVQLTRAHFKEEVRAAIRRGTIRHNVLVRKFADPDNARLTKAFVSEIVLEVQREMVEDYSEHDPRMELLGYLAQGDLVLENLNDLLDSGLKPKEKVQVATAIQAFWEKRIGFLKFIGAFNKLLDPAKPQASMLETGGDKYIEADKYTELASQADDYDVQDGNVEVTDG